MATKRKQVKKPGSRVKTCLKEEAQLPAETSALDATSRNAAPSAGDEQILIEKLEPKLSPQGAEYIAVPKEKYEPDRLHFHGTPTHPQLRELDFIANVQKSALQKHARQGWSSYRSLAYAAALQGVTRSRYELEERIAADVRNFNLLVERMRNAKVKGLDMELRNFHPARLDVSQYDDVKAITNFLMRHWDIRDLGDPIGRARLEEDVKRNYARGMQAGGSIFEEEFRKPPYDLVHGERFYKDSEKLLALAEKAIKRKKIK